MGQSQIKSTSLTVFNCKKTLLKKSWRGTRKGIMPLFGYSPSVTSVDIPEGNIFVPIQQDDILPQVPIGRHHPVPLTGVEDDDERALHTNKFYANAFLGQQNQPIWTHPYAIWWGNGCQDPGVFQTSGMNISHVEEADLIYGPGDPAKVGQELLRVSEHPLICVRATPIRASNRSSSPPENLKSPPRRFSLPILTYRSQSISISTLNQPPPNRR